MLCDLLTICSALVAVVICIISGLIIYARWNYGFLEDLGIPVVKPHFLFGSMFTTRFIPIGYRDVAWMKEYGQIFGVYEGREPAIYVCDPDILRLIMVKDISYFDAKIALDFGDRFLNEMPDYLPNNKWKIVRGFTGPAFSSAKLRLMSFPMKKSLVEWGSQLKDAITTNGGKLERCAFDDLLFDGLTDLTLRSMFSIQDKTGRFPRILKKLAKPGALNYPNLKAIALSFPVLFKFLPPALLATEPAQEFLHVMEDLVASRKVTNSPPDVVDLCIEQLKKIPTPDYQMAKVTKETILFQAFNFFFSGQDETALVISAMIYNILSSPAEQCIEEKLYDEIDRLWVDLEESNDDIRFPSRDSLLQADFLNACIYEALRLYTFYSAERVCTKSWLCEKYNFTIPKGTTIMTPLWAINRNPDYFENPDLFDPERFMPGRKEKLHSYAWSSFGHGPRNCTGKPLAMEVLRVSCAYIFKNFRFQLRPDTRLTFNPDGPWVFISHEPIYLDITVRE
ncbi:cytochrome P450 3A56-like [Bradysia coprophila]|uniref:cytochrome P450 3A56-like n=1 Tax=Bradysia coprophila TaxID=38358 RepID=UPI00187D9F55|nr:cytochrome P450 3A56-like [Bradysia coprophila]